MQPTRPTSVTVIAVLQLVFGGLGLCGAVFTFGSQSMGNKGFNMNQGPGADITQQMNDYMDTRLPSYKTVVTAELALGALLSVVMIASGVGMLNMHSWARTLGIGYAAVSILAKIVDVIYVLVFLIPALSDFCDNFAAKGGQNGQVAQAMKIGGTIGGLAAFATIIYPIIVLIVLLQPSVAAAFRGEGAGQGGPGDFDDYGRGGRGDAGYGQPPPAAGDDPGYRGAPEDRFGPPR